MKKQILEFGQSVLTEKEKKDLINTGRPPIQWGKIQYSQTKRG